VEERKSEQKKSERASEKAKERDSTHCSSFIYFLCIPLACNSMFNNRTTTWTNCFLWIC